MDDEEAILFAFSKILQTTDVQIDTAQSIEEVEALLLHSSYEAFIVDLRLNGTDQLDGLKVISLARQHCPGSKLIVITAYGGEVEKVYLKKASINAFLEKPVSPGSLKQILTDLGVY